MTACLGFPDSRTDLLSTLVHSHFASVFHSDSHGSIKVKWAENGEY